MGAVAWYCSTISVLVFLKYEQSQKTLEQLSMDIELRHTLSKSSFFPFIIDLGDWRLVCNQLTISLPWDGLDRWTCLENWFKKIPHD